MQNDLFTRTLLELHSEAPLDLLNSLRAHLEQIKSNPSLTPTAEACLDGLASDQSSLLHVLTAAYLINGGVMLANPEENDFDSLEEELKNFSMDSPPNTD